MKQASRQQCGDIKLITQLLVSLRAGLRAMRISSAHNRKTHEIHRHVATTQAAAAVVELAPLGEAPFRLAITPYAAFVFGPYTPFRRFINSAEHSERSGVARANLFNARRWDSQHSGAA